MELDVPSIIEGYAHGYFLMADHNNSLGWYETRERAIIPLDQKFHYPKSLQRFLNQKRFTVSINRAFQEVCQGCANRETTWISPKLQDIYWSLHQAGWAHSFETWQGDQLAGGILGIAIRGVFIGESMFYQIPEGSKVAMVKLVEHLRCRGFTLFDAQLQNPHLERFGAYVIPERDYHNRLIESLQHKCQFT